MAQPFRWGILGTGNIARAFAENLKALPTHALVGVASRSPQRAAEFCKQYGGMAVESYDALLDDPGIDAVYVSLPNHLHAEWSIRALAAGRHVLCEKPLAMNVAEAERMFAAARKADRLLVEAFMYRCHPQTGAILAAVRRGDIGRLTHIRLSFIFRIRNTAGNIRLDPNMGGGAMLDVGCYCIDLANLLADAPIREIRAIRRMHESGVDTMTSGLIAYENGVQATFTVGMDAQSDNAALIGGTDGYISVNWPWKPTNETAGYTLARGIPPRQDLKPGETAVAPPPVFVEAKSDLPTFALEARAFAAACRGEAEPFMLAAASLANLAVMETARRDWAAG